MESVLLLLAVLVPTLGSLALPIIGRSWPRGRTGLAFLLIVAALACSAALIPSVWGGRGSVSAGELPPLPLFSAAAATFFRADALAVFTACVASLISAVVVLYSIGYIRNYPHQNEYYWMVVLFLGSMMGLVFAANLLAIYVFWELTAIASWRLIGFFRQPGISRRADKAFLITAFGAVSMLLGFVVLFVQAGTLDLAGLAAFYKVHALPDLAVGLILLGILSKSATLPFHTWLPDAGVAPSPVTALLHAAVLVKIGVYVFARLFVVALPLGSLAFWPGRIDWNQAVLVVAAASALVSAAAATVEHDIKRIIAFSTISQIAFIFLGLASGTQFGQAGAVLYILMHGLAKGGLFLIAGVIEHGVGTKDIRRMGGLLPRMPITAVCFLLCAFSVMGLPPFGGFFSKYMVMGGAAAAHPAITLVFLLGAVMTMVYLLRLFRMVFLGEPASGQSGEHVHEGTPIMLVSVALLAVLGLVAGLATYWPAKFAADALGLAGQGATVLVSQPLLLAILVPLLGVVLLLLPAAVKSARRLCGPITVIAAAANLAVAAWLAKLAYAGAGLAVVLSWGPIEFALKLTRLNAFVAVAAAGFGLVIAIYCLAFMRSRPRTGQFYFYLLLTLVLSNGAVLADHLVTMLFFWEALLLPLFGMISIGRGGSWRTAIKALLIVGLSDLCLMVGIALFGWQSGSLSMSGPAIPAVGLGALAMVLMLIAALGKGGAAPLHTWIPDAAIDAPLPFMALVPAAIEKLLGIYLLARITLDLFVMVPGSWISLLLMIVGAATILVAVAMALIQKDYKRLLSYHAVSQVGYMVLGLGTATVFGVVGGLFHMINHALYKSLLFLTGGAVEHRAGTSDLAELGGLARRMPITAVCFIVGALSISGFPLTNGFFSKELIYDGALHVHWAFYAAAVLGSFLTAVSFLKLGHAAYFGKPGRRFAGAREASPVMLLPMLALVAGCVLFAFNGISLGKWIIPAIAHVDVVRDHNFAAQPLTGWPHLNFLTIMTVVALSAAVINHVIGVSRTGHGLGAADHIHHAPVLRGVYGLAERRFFDPYDIAAWIGAGLVRLGWHVDRAIDWFMDGLPAALGRALSAAIGRTHAGNYSWYAVWSLIAAAVVIVFLVRNS